MLKTPYLLLSTMIILGFTVHSVTLTWTASTSPNVVGYNIYRSEISGGPYTKITPTLVTELTYIDLDVISGHTYYYVATAVDNVGSESVYSSPEASGTIPFDGPSGGGPSTIGGPVTKAGDEGIRK